VPWPNLVKSETVQKAMASPRPAATKPGQKSNRSGPISSGGNLLYVDIRMRVGMKTSTVPGRMSIGFNSLGVFIVLRVRIF
jgi:hypothetical protein